MTKTYEITISDHGTITIHGVGTTTIPAGKPTANRSSYAAWGDFGKTTEEQTVPVNLNLRNPGPDAASYRPERLSYTFDFTVESSDWAGRFCGNLIGAKNADGSLKGINENVGKVETHHASTYAYNAREDWVTFTPDFQWLLLGNPTNGFGRDSVAYQIGLVRAAKMIGDHVAAQIVADREAYENDLRDRKAAANAVRARLA
jgi:hypothetical protein